MGNPETPITLRKMFNGDFFQFELKITILNGINFFSKGAIEKVEVCQKKKLPPS